MLFTKRRVNMMAGSCRLITTCDGAPGDDGTWHTASRRHERLPAGRGCAGGSAKPAVEERRRATGIEGGAGGGPLAMRTLRSSTQLCRSSTCMLYTSSRANKPLGPVAAAAAGALPSLLPLPSPPPPPLLLLVGATVAWMPCRLTMARSVQPGGTKPDFLPCSRRGFSSITSCGPGAMQGKAIVVFTGGLELQGSEPLGPYRRLCTGNPSACMRGIGLKRPSAYPGGYGRDLRLEVDPVLVCSMRHDWSRRRVGRRWSGGLGAARNAAEGLRKGRVAGSHGREAQFRAPAEWHTSSISGAKAQVDPLAGQQGEPSRCVRVAADPLLRLASTCIGPRSGLPHLHQLHHHAQQRGC
jgi:hypothetical protein